MSDESGDPEVIDTIIEEMIQQHKDILNLLERIEVLEQRQTTPDPRSIKPVVAGPRTKVRIVT